jgi:hypothetical protein
MATELKQIVLGAALVGKVPAGVRHVAFRVAFPARRLRGAREFDA